MIVFDVYRFSKNTDDNLERCKVFTDESLTLTDVAVEGINAKEFTVSHAVEKEDGAEKPEA